MSCRGVLLFVLAFATVFQLSTAADADCSSLMKEYYKFNRQQLAGPSVPHELLYVLRTPQSHSDRLDACLLRPGVPGSKRCPSTDQITPGVARKLKGCSLLSSENDLSVLGSLSGDVAVAAQLRDPVERVVAAYETALEVAVQGLQAAGSKNPFEAMQRRHPLGEAWPWAKLTPLLTKDLQQRAEELEDELDLSTSGNWVQVYDTAGTPSFVNTLTDEVKASLSAEEQQQLLPALDPYDNELAMPLKDFVKHPRVLQVLHNGALLQILGLTNTSSWEKAQEMRGCVRKDAAVADELFSYAAKRLDAFAFVGLADQPTHSAELAASTLDLTLSGPAYAPGEVFIPGVKKVKVMSFTGGMKPDSINSDAKTVEVDTDDVEATTPEEIQALIEVKEKEATELYNKAYDLFVKGKGTQQEVAAARAQVSAAKAAVMQLKFDLEQMEAQKDLDKTLEGTLADEYHNCVSRIEEGATKQSLKTLSTLAMPDGRQIRFTAEARQKIPAQTVEEIRKLNALDVKLYEHAKQLVQQRRDALAAAGKLQTLPALTTAGDAGAAAKTEEL